MRALMTVIVASLALAIGCASENNEPSQEAGLGEVGSSSLALIVNVPGETDVTGLRITVHREACGLEEIEPAQFVVESELEGPMPGDLVPGSGAAGLNADDEYYFLDNYWVLPAGCYGVEIVALNAVGEPSDACEPASASGIVVEDGRTTEIVLVSECLGTNDPVGGLDVVGVLDLNMPPQIEVEGLDFNPSKFQGACARTTICATAFDPDGDELVFEWAQTGGDPLAGPVVVSYDVDGNAATECVGVLASTIGAYELTVTVYDLQDGAIDADSFDDLVFPFYSDVNCR